MTTAASRSHSGLDPALADVMEALAERVQRGEAIDAEALLREHPDYAEQLERLLPAVQLMAALSASAPADVGPLPGGDASPGTLGDYRIVREAGRGGMGVVYEAEQISLRRRVALKVLPFAGAMDPRQLQRFRNEATAAASLRNEHIVHVYGVGCERGVHYYAMEFIEGTTLAAVIAGLRRPADSTVTHPPGGAASPTAPAAALSTRPGGPHGREFHRAAAGLVADAADALEHAHQLGIVHRDVKPGNLMLDTAGKIYVTDFGLARLGTDPGLTATGDLLGTLRYMAPEQALAKHGLVDHRADVYALGATLYEVLTLRPAVPGDDKADVLRRIAFDEPAAPRSIDPAIPRDLETVVLKCLEKEPARRYQSAGELAVDLRRWLRNEPVKARRPTAFDRVGKWAGRHRALVALTLSFLAVATTGLTAGVVLLKRANEDEASQRALAKDNLRMSLKAIEDTAWLAYEALVYRPTRPTKEEVQQVERLLTFYADLAQKNPDDRQLRLETAKSYVRAGLIFAATGQKERGETVLRKGVALAAELATDWPAERADSRWASGYHARSLYELGLFLQQEKRPAEAAQAYREAISVAEPVWNSLRGPQEGVTIGSCHAQLSEMHLRSGRRDEALAELRNAIRYSEQLAALEPNAPEHVGRLGLRLSALARLLANGGQIDEAESLARQAMMHTQAALDREPDKNNWLESLAQIHGALAQIAGKRKLPDQQLAGLQTQASILEKLAASRPDLTAYRGQLAVVNYDVGIVLNKAGRQGEALTWFAKVPDRSGVYPKAAYARTWLRLTAKDHTLRDPAEALRLAQWGAARKVEGTGSWLIFLALAQHRAGDSPAALKTLEKLAADPGGDTIDVYFVRAMALHRLGQHDMAREKCKAAIEVMNEGKYKDDPMMQVFRDEALRELGLTEADVIASPKDSSDTSGTDGPPQPKS